MEVYLNVYQYAFLWLLYDFHFCTVPVQANYGGVKGRIPSALQNQDPSLVSSQRSGKEASAGGDSDEEGEEVLGTPPNDEQLNTSDTEDDEVVSTYTAVTLQTLYLR